MGNRGNFHKFELTNEPKNKKRQEKADGFFAD